MRCLSSSHLRLFLVSVSLSSTLMLTGCLETAQHPSNPYVKWWRFADVLLWMSNLLFTMTTRCTFLQLHIWFFRGCFVEAVGWHVEELGGAASGGPCIRVEMSHTHRASFFLTHLHPQKGATQVHFLIPSNPPVFSTYECLTRVHSLTQSSWMCKSNKIEFLKIRPTHPDNTKSCQAICACICELGHENVRVSLFTFWDSTQTSKRRSVTKQKKR